MIIRKSPFRGIEMGAASYKKGEKRGGRKKGHNIERYGKYKKCDENHNLIDFKKICYYSGKIQTIIVPD